MGRRGAVWGAVACLGTVLFGTGIGFLVASYDDSRGRLIEQYNAAVRTYTANQAAFVSGKFRLVNHKQSFPLTLVKTHDQLNDHAGEGETLLQYEGLAFALPREDVEVLLPPRAFSTSDSGTGSSRSDDDHSVSIEFEAAVSPGQDATAPVNSASDSGPGGTFSAQVQALRDRVENFKDVCENSKHRSWCVSKNCEDIHGKRRGQYDCVVREALSELCFRVAADTTRRGWVVPNATLSTSAVTDTGGCVFTPLGYDISVWAFTGLLAPAVYTPLAANAWESKHSFRHANVTLRLASDPWVAAAAITNGSLNFGLSNAVQYRAAVWLLASSILLCALPVVLGPARGVARKAFSMLSSLASRGGSAVHQAILPNGGAVGDRTQPRAYGAIPREPAGAAAAAAVRDYEPAVQVPVTVLVCAGAVSLAGALAVFLWLALGGESAGPSTIPQLAKQST